MNKNKLNSIFKKSTYNEFWFVAGPFESTHFKVSVRVEVSHTVKGRTKLHHIQECGIRSTVRLKDHNTCYHHGQEDKSCTGVDRLNSAALKAKKAVRNRNYFVVMHIYIYLLWKGIEHKKNICSISKEVSFHDFLFFQNFVSEDKKPWYNKQKAKTRKPGIQS